MVIILLDADEAIKLIRSDGGNAMTAGSEIAKIVGKYFPSAHIMDKEKMAEGYKEMSAINLAIANGDQER